MMAEEKSSRIEGEICKSCGRPHRKGEEQNHRFVGTVEEKLRGEGPVLDKVIDRAWQLLKRDPVIKDSPGGEVYGAFKTAAIFTAIEAKLLEGLPALSDLPGLVQKGLEDLEGGKGGD